MRGVSKRRPELIYSPWGSLDYSIRTGSGISVYQVMWRAWLSKSVFMTGLIRSVRYPHSQVDILQTQP